MSKKINQIDWKAYDRQGRCSPDILSLISNLSSNDWSTREDAAYELRVQLEWAYEKVNNKLPYDIIPILVELLQSERLQNRALVTDILIMLTSYSEIDTLNEQNKLEALQLKDSVCECLDTYKSFLNDEAYNSFLQNADFKEDIVYLVELCE